MNIASHHCVKLLQQASEPGCTHLVEKILRKIADENKQVEYPLQELCLQATVLTGGGKG